MAKKKNKKAEPDLIEKFYSYYAAIARLRADHYTEREKMKLRAQIRRMKSSILATPAPVEYLDSYLQQVIGVAYEEDDCAYEDPVGPHYWWAISLRALEWTTRNYDGSAYDAWKHISKEFTKKYGYAPEAVSFTKQGRETILLIGYVQEEEEEVEEDPNILTLQEQLIRQSYSQT